MVDLNLIWKKILNKYKKVYLVYRNRLFFWYKYIYISIKIKRYYGFGRDDNSNSSNFSSGYSY